MAETIQFFSVSNNLPLHKANRNQNFSCFYFYKTQDVPILEIISISLFYTIISFEDFVPVFLQISVCLFFSPSPQNLFCSSIDILLKAIDVIHKIFVLRVLILYILIEIKNRKFQIKNYSKTIII